MIYIFSIAMGANHSSYVRTIEMYAHAFLTVNILAIGRVKRSISVDDFLQNSLIFLVDMCMKIVRP